MKSALQWENDSPQQHIIKRGAAMLPIIEMFRSSCLLYMNDERRWKLKQHNNNSTLKTQVRLNVMSSSSSPLSSEAISVGDGYVATHKSLHNLLSDLLSTVKGLRHVQVEQGKRIDALMKQVENQQDIIQSLQWQLQKQQQQQGQTTVLETNTTKQRPQQDHHRATTTTTSPRLENATTNKDDEVRFAKLRRELVGMIGSALAQHEEDVEQLTSKIARLESQQQQQVQCKTNKQRNGKN